MTQKSIRTFVDVVELLGGRKRYDDIMGVVRSRVFSDQHVDDELLDELNGVMFDITNHPLELITSEVVDLAIRFASDFPVYGTLMYLLDGVSYMPTNSQEKIFDLFASLIDIGSKEAEHRASDMFEGPVEDFDLAWRHLSRKPLTFKRLRFLLRYGSCEELGQFQRSVISLLPDGLTPVWLTSDPLYRFGSTPNGSLVNVNEGYEGPVQTTLEASELLANQLLAVLSEQVPNNILRDR